MSHMERLGRWMGDFDGFFCGTCACEPRNTVTMAAKKAEHHGYYCGLWVVGSRLTSNQKVLVWLVCFS